MYLHKNNESVIVQVLHLLQKRSKKFFVGFYVGKDMAELYYDKLHKNICHTIRMGYIYTITNKTDNKTYVGQTIRELDTRWKDHLKKRSNCRYLKSAINKYGVENFVFKLVCITFDNMLDDMEIQYIQKYNCLVPNGYNLRLGGNSGTHNAETKQKIAETLLKNKKVVQFDIQGNRLNSFNSCTEAAKSVGISPSTIAHCCNGDIKTAAGFRWKYESNDTKSVSGIAPLTGRFKHGQPSTKPDVITQIPRKIIQFDIHGTRLKSFDTCKQAAEYVGASRSFISTCCLNPNQTGKGFYWKYESINTSIIDPGGQDEIYKQIISKRNRKVVQFDIHGNRLNAFDNCNEAAKYVGAESSNINRCCNGKIQSAKGFVWKYEPIVK